MQASFFERAKIHNTCIGSERKTGFFSDRFYTKEKSQQLKPLALFALMKRLYMVFASAPSRDDTDAAVETVTSSRQPEKGILIYSSLRFLATM